MLAKDCPEWKYSDHPNITVLSQCVANELKALRRGRIDTLEVAKDTRPVHHAFFRRLTPLVCPYYAGHYRGALRLCLQIREVGVSNGFVIVHRGTPAAEVSAVMARFENTIQTSLAILDGVHEEPDSNVSAEDKIRFAVRVACELFIELQGIHPYLDGNGHMGRFLIWVILGRYGYWPIRWRIEPRPVTQPDYISLIQDYKAGRPDSLQNFIYSCIDPIDPCPPLVVN